MRYVGYFVTCFLLLKTFENIFCTDAVSEWVSSHSFSSIWSAKVSLKYSNPFLSSKGQTNPRLVMMQIRALLSFSGRHPVISSATIYNIQIWRHWWVKEPLPSSLYPSAWRGWRRARGRWGWSRRGSPRPGTPRAGTLRCAESPDLGVFKLKKSQLVLWLRKPLSLGFFGGSLGSSLGVLWRLFGWLLADSWLTDSWLALSS